MTEKTKEHGNFIIRIYAIIINDKQEVLVSDEYMFDMCMTKFPGGGLIQGEGPVDCLKREAMEEFGQEIEIISHFYTTDFYQEASFFQGYQLISIYYLARFTGPLRFRISDRPFDFTEMKEGSQSFRWRKICELTKDDMTFPIDKEVAEKLRYWSGL